jgi:group I intron endonuclease
MGDNLKGVIYKLTSPNNKIYIGQTIDFEQRCKKYKYGAFKGQIRLWNNCQKHKWNPIDNIEILEICSINELDKREIYWINEYNSFIDGLNLDLGGKGKRGFKHSDETKEKIRKANIGKKHSDEAKAKISEASKNMSDETKKKISDSNKGKKITDEHKKIISVSNTGRKLSKDHKLKLSKINIGNKKRLDKKHSDETKKKISFSKKGVSNTLKKIKIICITTGDIYESATDAGKILKLNQQSISRVCNKERKTYKGLNFMFYEEYLKINK